MQLNAWQDLPQKLPLDSIERDSRRPFSAMLFSSVVNPISSPAPTSHPNQSDHNVPARRVLTQGGGIDVPLAFTQNLLSIGCHLPQRYVKSEAGVSRPSISGSSLSDRGGVFS